MKGRKKPKSESKPEQTNLLTIQMNGKYNEGNTENPRDRQTELISVTYEHSICLYTSIQGM